jgi:hypothetical protein
VINLTLADERTAHFVLPLLEAWVLTQDDDLPERESLNGGGATRY